MPKLKALTLLFILAIACTLLATPAAAQSTTEGGISGIIYDSSGAVVPNATVVIHNNGTSQEQQTRSDASGEYRVGQLQPATYTVSVSAAGFAPYKALQVIVQIGTVTEVSPKLKVGGTTEVVDVGAEAPQINTTSADFAPVVNQTAIQNLPINGGRWSSFVLLTPGAVNDSNGFGLISFKGMSTLLNNNTVDGADNNQAFFSEERGRTRGAYAFPKAAVQEFQVNTSNYSVEYGRSAGAVVNSVTKSGTNALHGEMYFYDRDNTWGAFNPYATIRLAPTFAPVPIKPTDWRKISGINIGGPIIKNKLFFSFTYDWYHRNFPGVSIANNPTAFFAAPACCTSSPAATLLSSSTAPNISNLAQRVYGANNAATQAQATALYNNLFSQLVSTSGPTPRVGEQTIWFPKLDWQINQKNHASFEVDRQRWASPAGIQTQSTVTFGRTSFGNDYVKVTTGVARLDTLFTSNLANEFRASYGRDFEFENPQTPSTPFEQANLITSPLFSGYTNQYNLPPEVQFSNGWTIGTADFLNRPKFPSEYRQQYADTVTWTHGKHTFKFGEDFTHVLDDSANLRFQYGSFNYSTNLINFFSDLSKPNSCQAPIGGVVKAIPCYSSFAEGFGPQGFKFATNEYAFFGQDEWRVLPRLTLTAGLRWDYEKMPSPFSALVNPAIPQTSKLPNDKNNFGPRVGFALDLFGNGKTALRGGYGMFYARIINSTIYNALTNTAIPGAQFQFTFTPTNVNTSQCALAFPLITTTALPAASCQAGGAIVFFDKHFQNPQIHQADLTLEQNFGWDTVVSLSYLGSFGRELPDFTDENISPSTSNATYTIVGGGPINAPTITVPIYTARPNIGGYTGALTDIFSGVTSSYHALTFQVNHRMSRHIQFSTHFTWSHAIDYGQNNTTFSSTNATFDPHNLKLEKGNSNQNVPKRFVFNAVAESPWNVKNPILGFFANNWQLSPLYQWQNGLDYSARTSGTSPVCNATVITGGINCSNGDFRISFIRNQFLLPNTQVVDLKLSKLIRYKERYTLELSGEAFNLMNHQNITAVSTTAYTAGGTAANPTLTFNPGFGAPSNANSNFALSPRQVQLGVRILF